MKQAAPSFHSLLPFLLILPTFLSALRFPLPPLRGLRGEVGRGILGSVGRVTCASKEIVALMQGERLAFLCLLSLPLRALWLPRALVTHLSTVAGREQSASGMLSLSLSHSEDCESFSPSASKCMRLLWSLSPCQATQN